MEQPSAQPILTTERLELCPFAATDEARLFRLYGNSDVMDIRKIGTQSREQSQVQLQAIVEHWQSFGFGLWAVTERDSGAFMGECGLRHEQPGSDNIELSYGFLPQFWGRGMGSEAARVSLDFGFRTLGMEKIYGLAKSRNAASRHILESLGMSLVEERKDGAETVVRYAATHADYFNDA